ncbi:phage protein Gp37, partial [Acinetobacter baumannii]|uniref:phage protein Gp37 n=2 Tax=Moraxellaceae TaxID=468 RepID=UPI0030E18352
MINLSVVEQGLKQVMANQVTDKKWTWVRQIKTYGGEFDDGLTAIVKGFPAIWVVFEGSGTPKKISYNKTQYPVTFVVLVGARSVRNEEARRQGAGGDIGTYEMLDHVHQLLIGNDLSSVGVKGLEPLELGKTKTILNTKTASQSISVLSQAFTTQYTITASDRDREEADESIGEI